MIVIIALLTICSPTVAELVEQADRSADFLEEEVLRFGFSKMVFADVNQADGLAAVQIWTENFAVSNDIDMRVESTVFSDTDDLKRALVEGRVDMINITTAEYRALRPYLDTERIFLSTVNGDTSAQYLLLVKADSPFAGVEDLQGRSLLVLENLQTSIAPHWLDRQLSDVGLPPTGEHFGNIGKSTSASRVILPVFFGKTDACLVSRGAYETAIELNPQIGKRTRVLCQSPRLIPGAACFRATYPDTMKNRIFNDTEGMHTDPRGEQVLLLFKTERLVMSSGRDLESTLRVIEHDRAGDKP